MKITPMRSLAAAAALLALAACSGDSTGSGATPAQLDIVAGDVQTATAGTALAQPLRVRALDAAGNPVSGTPVRFRVVSGGGTLSDSLPRTDAQGFAQATWTLGPVAGDTQRVAVAPVAGTAPEVTFRAVATAGAPATLAAVSGGGQSAGAGAQLAAPLVVRVTDARGNAVPGVAVTWGAQGGGTITPLAPTTDGSGYARATWRLGTTGTQQATATVAGLPAVTFTATLLDPTGQGLVLAKTAGDQQTGASGARLADSLEVTLRTSGGAPVAGATILWSGNGTASPATTVTDAAGRSRAAWTLAQTTGMQQMTATVSGTTTRVTFTATVPQPPASAVLSKYAGDGQSGFAGQLLPKAVAVRVATPTGAALPGVVVHWTVLSGGGSVIDSTTTDSNGVASTAWRLGTASGPDSLRASIATGQSVNFGATRLPALLVTIVTPPDGTYKPKLGDTVQVLAGVQGSVTAQQVVAQIADRTVNLTVDASGLNWSGTLLLTGVPSGTYTLTVTAYGPSGEVGKATRSVTIDRKPVLSVTAPATKTTVGTSVPYSATCQDVEAPCTVRVDIVYPGGSAAVASGTGSVSGTLNLSPFVGTTIDVFFTAIDSAGQQTQDLREYKVQ
jgi:hypothetical protein